MMVKVRGGLQKGYFPLWAQYSFGRHVLRAIVTIDLHGTFISMQHAWCLFSTMASIISQEKGHMSRLKVHKTGINIYIYIIYI